MSVELFELIKSSVSLNDRQQTLLKDSLKISDLAEFEYALDQLTVENNNSALGNWIVALTASLLDVDLELSDNDFYQELVDKDLPAGARTKLLLKLVNKLKPKRKSKKASLDVEAAVMNEEEDQENEEKQEVNDVDDADSNSIFDY